jgi:hypothetical protein
MRILDDLNSEGKEENEREKKSSLQLHVGPE